MSTQKPASPAASPEIVATCVYNGNPNFPAMIKVINAICPDGKRRTARITGQPDTFFSQPAKIVANGKTVTGFISSTETAAGLPDVSFSPYLYATNGDVFGFASDEERAVFEDAKQARQARQAARQADKIAKFERAAIRENRLYRQAANIVAAVLPLE